jgi:hypothetical protein
VEFCKFVLNCRIQVVPSGAASDGQYVSGEEILTQRVKDNNHCFSEHNLVPYEKMDVAFLLTILPKGRVK